MFLSLYPSIINLLFFVEKPLHSCFHHVWSTVTVRTYSMPRQEKKQKPLKSSLWSLCGEKCLADTGLHYLFEWRQLYKRLLRIWPHQFTLMGEKAGVTITLRIIKRELPLVSMWFKILFFSQPIYCMCMLNTRTVHTGYHYFIFSPHVSLRACIVEGKASGPGTWCKWRRCVQLQKDKNKWARGNLSPTAGSFTQIP